MYYRIHSLITCYIELSACSEVYRYIIYITMTIYFFRLSVSKRKHTISVHIQGYKSEFTISDRTIKQMAIFFCVLQDTSILNIM